MIRKRLQSRDEKFLSKAGKEVLLKAVAQLLPSYTMNVFLLPLEITRDMESMMAKFWWLDSLAARVFKARYFPNGTFLNASLGNNSSFVWRSILEAQHLIREGVHWCVGNGEDINILDEPWLPIKENPYVSSLHPGLFNYEESTLYILVTCEVVRSCWNRVGIGTNVAMNIDFFDWSAKSSEYESSWPGFQAGYGAKHWISPQANSIKVNIDAALFDSDHKYGLGLVARDERGLLIERRTMLSNGSIEPELAEAMGVREALSWIKER
uniref:RNase H type-1 domain-containing protein n=1 Tax=Cannabis sativa TaxID=3483 RepID=A0A803NHJ6_CANSA